MMVHPLAPEIRQDGTLYDRQPIDRDGSLAGFMWLDGLSCNVSMAAAVSPSTQATAG